MDFLGDPGSIERVASELTTAHGALTTTQGDVTSGVSRVVPGSWQGSAAGAFQGHMATEGSAIETLARTTAQMASVLNQLASTLRRAQSLAQQAEGIAHAHGLTVGSDGQVSMPVGRAGLPPDPAQVRARAEAQTVMDGARSTAHGAQAQASAALSGLSVPQVQPGVSVQAAAAWAQQGVPKSFGEDLWKALRGNVLPPSAMGALGVGLWGFGRGLSVMGGTSSWMTKVVLGRFAPRGDLGRFVSPADMSLWERAIASTDGKNWVANPFMSDTRGAWASVGKWGGRAGGVLAIGTSALGQWMQDSGNPNLDTSQRIGRSAYRGVVAGGAAWGGAVAGAEAGAAIGTLIGPEGTVIGGIVGGIAGGVIGSGVGNWVVDHTVNAVGDGAKAVTHAVGDAGSTVIHDVGSAGSSVIHGAGHVLSDLNPF